MPVTPFHFGPGALLKALVPHHFSWTTFALANGLIDLEPISNFLLTGDPAHRFFHTLPGEDDRSRSGSLAQSSAILSAGV